MGLQNGLLRLEALRRGVDKEGKKKLKSDFRERGMPL